MNQKILLLNLLISFHLSNFSITDHQQALIEHVKQSIQNAELGISKLTPEILNLEGMSSDKVRHFLNNLCSLFNTRYLEIGVWKGSTFISALYQNNVINATAIDNWSEFAGPKQTFLEKVAQFLLPNTYNFYECDCFQFNLNYIPNKINIYFYDGGHTKEDQRLAFTYYNDIFDDTFIAVVDDYNWPPVQDGTQEAFKQLNYKILYEKILPASFNGDKANWWNGLYVAVLSKN